MSNKKTIGFICSSGGATVNEILMATKNHFNFIGIVDRECAAIEVFKKHNIKYKLINNRSNQLFSEETQSFFASEGVSLALTFYRRFIEKVLFDRILCINFHPSCLPSYPGLSAVERQFKDKAKTLSSTMHLIDDGVDAGKIIKQVTNKVEQPVNMEDFQKTSFLQISYLALILFDYMIASKADLDLMNIQKHLNDLNSHSLKTKECIDVFKDMQIRNNKYVS